MAVNEVIDDEKDDEVQTQIGDNKNLSNVSSMLYSLQHECGPVECDLYW